VADSITKHPNDANYVVRHLSTKPNDALKDFDEWIAFLSTPFKRLGIQGWTQTGAARADTGNPYGTRSGPRINSSRSTLRS
jgi:hypothetical protein